MSASRLSVPRAFVATTLLLLALLAATVVTVNPWAYYPVHLVRPIVWLPHVEKVQRLMPAFLAPDIVVIGSSRAMKIEPAFVTRVTGKRAFNAATPAAAAEDASVMLHYMVERLGWRPSELVWGVDMTALRAGPVNMNAFMLPELRQYLPWRLRLSGYEEALRAMVSFPQLRDAAKGVWFSVTTFPAQDLEVQPDGATRTDSLERQMAAPGYVPPAVIAKDDQFTESPFDPARVALFDETVRYARAHGIAIRIFLTPYHPLLLQHYDVQPAFVSARRTLVDHLERLHREDPAVRYADFSDIRAFDGVPSAFWDSVHYGRANAERLVSRLYAVQ